MSYSGFNFTSGPSSQNQTIAPGMQQYLAQGQAGINPGQVQVAASNPVSTAAQYGLARALANNQQPTLPAQTAPLVGSLQNPASSNQAANLSYDQLQSQDANAPYIQGMSSGIQGVANPSYAQQLGSYLASLLPSGDD
jgi:hypothetical protein